MRTYTYLLMAFAALILTSCTTADTAGKLVRNIDEFNQAVAQAQPGDVIVLAKGNWKDTELLFEGIGSSEAPITLTVEEKGGVVLSGASNLRMAGEYLVVEGLVFKDGYTPTTEVISFKKDKDHLANNSRLTECVIDNFNNPERHEPDTWLAIYGKNNRIDHNHLEGKRNRGVTMIVRLNTEESRENSHRIDHNYFGPRQNLGSNGGETLRIGTSHYSLTNSKTLVEANYFDRCNGEHEIISNKSCQNTYLNNVFYECTGTLTMRHGNETLVEGNVFLGNHKPSTGGIRVINGQQTVRNNYGYGLTGYRFRGAFVIMNGVPNSPINRYFQVEDANVTNNTFIDCDHFQFCAGSDAERSAVPINSTVAGNVFYNTGTPGKFTVYDDISGITFKDNLISPQMEALTDDGFSSHALEFEESEHGFKMPVGLPEGVGATISPEIATRENTGVAWYSKAKEEAALSSGKVISVAPGLNSLVDAVNTSSAGDIIELTEEGPYATTKTIVIKHPLTFRSATDARSKVTFEKKSLFEIENGGSLRLENLILSGEAAPDRTGNSVITTSKYSMNKNYKLFVEGCLFTDLDVNHSFDAIRVYKNTFADTISITNSRFETISGNMMALDKETDDIGIYNAEYVILKNNVFENIGGAALRLHRGGKDESTFGPFLQMSHNTINNVGHGSRNKYGASVSLYGVQEIDIRDNIFSEAKGVNMHLVVGEPIVEVAHNNFHASEEVVVTGDQQYTLRDNWTLDPQFKDEVSYELSENSKLKGKASDGGDPGIIK